MCMFGRISTGISFLVFCLSLLCSGQVYTQQIGIPFIKSFSKELYGYGTQNWEVDQDHQGVLYFANNDGMVSFDGRNWELFRLPSKTICRSLLVHGDEIYVGGQNEFGKFVKDVEEKWKFIFAP